MAKAQEKILSVEDISLKLFYRQGLFGRKTIEHWALKNVSFEVCRGEIFGVVGRNGAGKSSLLRALARIITPDMGNIKTYGARTCLLGLQSGFVDELTGRENAIMSGMLMGNSYKEMLAKLDEIQEFSELEKWFDQPILTYSSGMRSRLGFSVAMHVNADIILVDEALSAGDESFKAKAREAVKGLMHSNKTVILVSHNAKTIKEFTRRAIWIENGQVIADGKTPDVVRMYKQFLQEFRTLKHQPDRPKNVSAAALEKVLGVQAKDEPEVLAA